MRKSLFMSGQLRTTLLPRAVAIEIEIAERERQKKIDAILEARRRYEEAILDLDKRLIQLGYQRPILTNMAGGDVEEAFFEAYRNLHSIAKAAKAVGFAAERVRTFIKTYPEFKERFDMVRDEIVNDVDAGLINDLFAGKAMPIERIFFLKHNRPEVYARDPAQETARPGADRPQSFA